MGLLTQPPLSPAPGSSSTLIGVANQRLMNGLTITRGMAFAGTWSGGNARIYKWADPFGAPGTTTVVATSSAFLTNVGVLGSWGNQVFAGYNSFNAGTGGNEITITVMDATTFASDTEIVSELPLGNLDSSVASQQAGGLASDGTHVYYLLANSDQNSWVGKVLIADGSLVAQFQIPNPATGNARLGTFLVYDGAGSLYATGGNGNMWAAKIPVALASATVLDLGGVATTAAPQGFLDSNGFWVADYLTSATPRSFKVALDLLSSTTILCPRPQFSGPDAIADGYDGRTFWTVQGTSSSVATLTQYDKTSLLPLRVFDGTPVKNQFPSFIFPFENAVWWLSQAGSQSAKSFASLTPTFADPGVTPRPSGGRGAAW